MRLRKNLFAGLTHLALLAGAGGSLSGCTGVLGLNQIEERAGNVTVVFVNSTSARAAFTFGSYDALDRAPFGPVSLDQQLIEALQSTAPINVVCRRNIAIGTDDYVARVVETNADNVATFNPDAFDVTVHFSDAASGSDAEALPTAGTAEGLEVLLGVDFSCGDRLVFEFVEDADAPGGFRIDLTVIPDEEDDA